MIINLLAATVCYASLRIAYLIVVKPLIDREKSFVSAMKQLKALESRTYLETFTVSNGQYNNGDHF